MVECLFLEDLEIGALWTSPSRTVTETDVVFFAGMTGDYDPLHTDHEFAAKSHYGKTDRSRTAWHVVNGRSK